MRLINSFNNPDTGLRFANFLKSKHIETDIDMATNKDWGSDHYGTIECRVWIIKEDQLPQALKWLEEFNNDPAASRFDSAGTGTVMGHAFLQTPIGTSVGIKESRERKEEKESERSQPTEKKQKLGRVTFYVLIICTLLFIATQLTKPDVKEVPRSIPFSPLVSSKIEKELEYDYPKAFEIIDQITSLYGENALLYPNELPKEGVFLLKQFFATPFWQGVYDPIVSWLTGKNDWHRNLEAPLFEKIREGQIWRLFTPCLLHANILHILFNMMWLIVLGQQIEEKIGSGRYIVFIVIAAIVSNTAQYLMSGSNFIGFSGVICAMIVFIWARQRKAAWEGYQLERSTILFVTVFVLGMLAIQATSFFMEINGLSPLSAGIANTAHIAGAFTGYLLAQAKLFAWR
jgi:GlpG protein